MGLGLTEIKDKMEDFSVLRARKKSVNQAKLRRFEKNIYIRGYERDQQAYAFRVMLGNAGGRD